MKHIQVQHDENYKMMIKEMEERLKNWKEETMQMDQNIPHGKDVILPKLVHKFNVIPTKIPGSF